VPHSPRRKKEAREAHKSSSVAQKTVGLKAKLLHQKRHAQKVQMKKTLKAHDERNVKKADPAAVPDGALPTYLLDREGQRDAKAMSSAIKEKRKEKAAKFAVPLPKVRGIAEDEMFKVLRTGKSRSKSWKRMVTKATFVGEGFTRKPVKLERFVRPMALRYKKANVTHRMYHSLFCGLDHLFIQRYMQRTSRLLSSFRSSASRRTRSHRSTLPSAYSPRVQSSRSTSPSSAWSPPAARSSSESTPR
jgi:ribosomal protein S8E